MPNRMVTRSASLLLAAFVFAGCSDKEPTGVDTLPFEIGPRSFSILEAQTQQMTVTGIAAADVTWETDNPAVATVSSTGLVRGVSGGMAAISARSKADPTVLSSGTAQIIEVPSLRSGIARTDLAGSGRGTARFFKIDVPAGRTSLTVSMFGGTGDADLYVAFNRLPTDTEPNTATSCSSEASGNTETCTFVNPPAGTWFIRIQVWNAYAGASLRATFVP